MVSVKKATTSKVPKKNPVKIEKKSTKTDKKVIHKIIHNEPQLAASNKSVADKKEKEKKCNYVMPSKYITENVVNSSISALQQLAAHHKKTNVLFDDEQPIFAEIRCIKIQNARGNIKL